MREKDNIEMMVMDDTYEMILALWEALAASATTWKPSSTILLLTNPGYRAERNGKLCIHAETLLDVDPTMYDADWLRQHAQKLAKRDHVNPPFPENGMRASTSFRCQRGHAHAMTVFDVETAVNSDVRILFTLGDIDEL